MPKVYFGTIRDRQHVNEITSDAIPQRAKVRFAYGHGFYQGPKDYIEIALIYWTHQAEGDAMPKIYGISAKRRIFADYAYKWQVQSFKVNVELELRNIEKVSDREKLKRPIMKALVMLEDLQNQWLAGISQEEDQQQPIDLTDELDVTSILNPGEN